MNTNEIIQKCIDEKPIEKVNATPSIELSEEQRVALNQIIDWLKNQSATKPIFKLGGYAGTGKTTLIREVQRELSDDMVTIVVAFTGKAVHVLQKKGLRATTIHSTIYNVDIKKDGTYEFYLKSRLDGNPDLIIVDEASMISTELYQDLLSFGIPILFVGDPGQLEPVGDNPQLMVKPDFVLNTIHRQAAQSPIITLANNIRMGGLFQVAPNQDKALIKQKAKFSVEVMFPFSQVICAKNATRTKLNAEYRRAKSFPAMSLAPDEKCIVLKNNRNFGVFNGMILYYVKTHQETYSTWVCDFVDELGNVYPKLPVWKKPFQGELKKGEYPTNREVWMDFAYAITCHKSQGSEWNSVLLYDEWMPPQVWDMRRWRYTGITRAADSIHIYV
jgi:exodeoxyribonuclease-5